MLGFKIVVFIFLAILAAIYFSGEKQDELDPAKIKDKRILITGASSGIGEEMAYQYSKLGASLMLTARREDLLRKVAAKCKELGASRAEYLAADMAIMKDRSRLVNETSTKLGGLDHLILNHAIFEFSSWKNSGENMTTLANNMEVNFMSFADIASRSMKMLQASNGSIGVVSSTGGKIPPIFGSTYAPSKFALDGFFSSLRQELIIKQIDVSITLIFFGYTRTEAAVKGSEALFKYNPFVPAEVDETALAIIKGVQNRNNEVYYPNKEWYIISVFSLFPIFGDFFFTKILPKIATFA